MNQFGQIRKPTIGIVGGLGPESTSKFYLKLIELARENSVSYPSLVIDNVAFPFYLEKEIIVHSKDEEKLFPFIKESIIRLNNAGASHIVIPCNTVHVFIESFRKVSSVPVISIVEESVKEIISNGFKCVGILGTTKTVDSEIYQKELSNKKIKFIIPSNESQNTLSSLIVNILEGKKNCNGIKKIANELVFQGCDCLLLACTELQLVISKTDFDVKVLDTMDVLSKKTFEILKE